MLNSLFKIKDEQSKVLDKLIFQKNEGLQLLKKSEQFKLGVANKKISTIKKSIQAYESLRSNFEAFYKTRLDFVIERSLNEIELKKFLDHIVSHDEDIRFVELSDMIRTIFREVSTELIVH